MDLYKEILTKILEKEDMHIVFPNMKINAAEIVEMKSYEALQKIKAIIQDDGLDDFMCIEKIVCELERLGSGGGNRHDFS